MAKHLTQIYKNPNLLYYIFISIISANVCFWFYSDFFVNFNGEYIIWLAKSQIWFADNFPFSFPIFKLHHIFFLLTDKNVQCYTKTYYN